MVTIKVAGDKDAMKIWRPFHIKKKKRLSRGLKNTIHFISIIQLLFRLVTNQEM